MSRTSSKQSMKRQSSFPFCREGNDNNRAAVIIDNIVRFDKNHKGGLASKKGEKREKIINKLLAHEQKLRW